MRTNSWAQNREIKNMGKLSNLQYSFCKLLLFSSSNFFFLLPLCRKIYLRFELLTLVSCRRWRSAMMDQVLALAGNLTKLSYRTLKELPSDMSSDMRGMAVRFYLTYLPNGPIHPYQLDGSISNLRGVWCTFSFFILFQIEICVSKRCRPWSDTVFLSDLGLHCLPRSQKWDVKHEYV